MSLRGPYRTRTLVLRCVIVLYLWPRDGEAPEMITVPVLTELVRIEGHFEEHEWARDIILQGADLPAVRPPVLAKAAHSRTA